MKPWQFRTVTLLAAACLGLTVATVFTARSNQRLQRELQTQQQAINNGVLGQQGQQVSQGILQSMAAAAVTNAGMRVLLERFGYRVPAAAVPTGDVATVSGALSLATNAPAGGETDPDQGNTAQPARTTGAQDEE